MFSGSKVYVRLVKDEGFWYHGRNFLTIRKTMRDFDWHSCKNILCVRPDNLGDVLMTAPAFRAIKESAPDARLTLLGSPNGAAIVPLIPEIDELITCKLPWETKERPDSPDELLTLIEVLRKRAFDGAVLFTNYSQNAFPAAFLCYLADIPRRLGYAKEYQTRLLTEWVSDPEPYLMVKHGVQRQLDLVGAVGFTTKDARLSLRIPDDAVKMAVAKLEQVGVDIHKPFIVVHPGASDSKRQYPVHLYAQAISKIIEDRQYQVIVTGVASEAPLSNSIMQGIQQGIFSLVGKLEISELAALISIAKLLISNNTGPVHIAAAVQTPVVDLYARTNPEHTPWKVKSRVLYFDVPEDLRNKTPVLAYMTPKAVKPMPTPSDIVSAVYELLTGESQQSRIAEEVTTW
jgi:lipopolysaccharide heptosyltransferase II